MRTRQIRTSLVSLAHRKDRKAGGLRPPVSWSSTTTYLVQWVGGSFRGAGVLHIRFEEPFIRMVRIRSWKESGEIISLESIISPDSLQFLIRTIQRIYYRSFEEMVRPGEERDFFLSSGWNSDICMHFPRGQDEDHGWDQMIQMYRALFYISGARLY